MSVVSVAAVGSVSVVAVAAAGSVSAIASATPPASATASVTATANNTDANDIFDRNRTAPPPHRTAQQRPHASPADSLSAHGFAVRCRGSPVGRASPRSSLARRRAHTRFALRTPTWKIESSVSESLLIAESPATDTRSPRRRSRSRPGRKPSRTARCPVVPADSPRSARRRSGRRDSLLSESLRGLRRSRRRVEPSP